MVGGVCTPALVTPSRSFQSFSRSLSQTTPESPPVSLQSPTAEIPFVPRTPDVSSSSSSSSSSASPGSTVSTVGGTPTSHYQRPSTLHGLKHKLHSAAKSVHSPGRRKSVGHIPLSPLARTPSPSPLPSSPTRSPSPLAFPPGHQPGSSNTTQSYSPGTSVATPGSAPKKGFGRAKSAEPGSPLLRRALSPDRLHPRTAEKAGPASISPLCDPALKVTMSAAPRVTITSKSPPVNKSVVDSDKELVKSKPPTKGALPIAENEQNNDGAKVEGDDFMIGGCQPLPRIAEEKDSPTAVKDEFPHVQLKREPIITESSGPPSTQHKSKGKVSAFKNICSSKKWKNKDTQSHRYVKDDDVTTDSKGHSSTKQELSRKHAADVKEGKNKNATMASDKSGKGASDHVDDIHHSKWSHDRK